ncbi:MAG: PD40 domain-containing protein [Deltaproteobacteria bacterium]|nr:PD40 domain-containing protein [Deltaproteobacteria bacterium]
MVERQTTLLLLAAISISLTWACAAQETSSGIASRISGGAYGKSKIVKRIEIIQDQGARPRFSPDGQRIVFDRRNRDGFSDIYLSSLEGEIVRDLTKNKRGIGQRNNGNAIFHPSGRYMVFISEVEDHAQKEMKVLGDPGLGLFCNL